MKNDLKLKGNRHITLDIICFLLFSLSAVAVFLGFYYSSWDVSGADTWGHFLKAEEMLDSLKRGDIFPIYSRGWYNGHQPFRHRAPSSYYLIALQLVLMRGNVRNAFMLFLAVLYFIGGLPWVIWGNIQNRRVRGLLFAILWFFLPGILKVFIAEGNTPQMLSTALTPYLMLFVWLYVRKQRKWARYGIFISMILISLSHLMITAIIGISFFIYLLIDGITQKTWKRGMLTLAYMVSGIATAGIWVIPAVLSKMNEDGGVGSGTIFYAPTLVILNPAYRFFVDRTEYYFGVLILLACIFGILFSKDRKIAGFVLPVVVLILTTPQIYQLISIIPLVKSLWVSRFAPVMYAAFFASMLEWTSIKKKYAALIYTLVIADILPSFFLGLYYIPTLDTTKEDIAYLRNITNHRASVMDLSTYAGYPSYGLCNDDGVDYTFGWAYQGADLAPNVMMLNSALEHGNFVYIFDRSIELGDDTILFQKDRLYALDYTFEDLDAAAQLLGYQLVYESNNAWFYQKIYPDSYGVVSHYYGIAIGEYAPEMTLNYPAFQVGNSDFIDEYSIEELSIYDTIFLSGFRYHDKATAEGIIRELDQAGIRIVIDSTHMPSDGITKNEEFFGVLNQRIEFSGHFPTLYINGEDYVLGRFGEDDMRFTTGYISYIDNPMGTFNYDDRELIFFGQMNGLNNTYFMALNLMYFSTSTHDDEAISILDSVFNISADILPARRIVPIEIEYGDNEITIVSPEDNVNTTLTYLDIFDSEQDLINSYNLLVVNEGTTVITMHYPHFILALVTTIIGTIMFGAIILIERKLNVSKD